MPIQPNSHVTPLIIISPHILTAEALQALLHAGQMYKVQGLFSDASACINAITNQKLSCPLVLLDLETEHAVATIAELMAAPDIVCRILALTGTTDSRLHDAAVTAGASGLVRKTECASVLMKALAHVADGELWLDRVTTGRIFQTLSRKKQRPDHDPEQDKINTLTRKERAIVSEIAAMPSASGQELAARLHISEHTLRNHLSAIYAKLDVANRTDLYAYARQHNIKNLQP